ncbi:MAG TPA: TolC family protein [Gemmatimonadales bacterium]|nr:TolC family protein [Gemmatimonadales bacterium]
MMLTLFLATAHLQTGDSLTLRAALERARAARGQVRATAAVVAAARAGVRVAGTVPNPVLSYGYTDDPPRQHVTLDQSLDWLLTRGSDQRAAQSEVSRSLADSAQAAADLAAEVRSAFYGALAAQEVERVSMAQARLADSLVTIADRRLASGDIAPLERDQMVLEARRAGTRLSLAREVREVAGTRLARAMGSASPSESFALAGSLDNGLDSLLAVSEAGQGWEMASPLVQAAVADSAGAAARAESAGRARAPLPSIVGGADWDNPGGPAGPLAVIGVSIPLPLWQHGSGALAAARADAARAAAQVSEARLESASRVAEARSRLWGAAERGRTARDSLLPLARTLSERATTAYKAGETGIIPLLEALRAERDVAAETIDDLLSFQEARAEWRRTRGEAE